MRLKSGKRYYWYPILVSGGSYQGKLHSGLFTGQYDKKNGNAILQTRYGELWSIPEKELKEKPHE